MFFLSGNGIVEEECRRSLVGGAHVEREREGVNYIIECVVMAMRRVTKIRVIIYSHLM